MLGHEHARDYRVSDQRVYRPLVQPLLCIVVHSGPQIDINGIHMPHDCSGDLHVLSIWRSQMLLNEPQILRPVFRHCGAHEWSRQGSGSARRRRGAWERLSKAPSGRGTRQKHTVPSIRPGVVVWGTFHTWMVWDIENPEIPPTSPGVDRSAQLIRFGSSSLGVTDRRECHCWGFRGFREAASDWMSFVLFGIRRYIISDPHCQVSSCLLSRLLET